MAIALTKNGQKIEFNYINSNIQTVTLTPGIYNVECYGAKGAGTYNYEYGECGTVKLTLTEITTLQIRVGSTGNEKKGGDGYNKGSNAISDTLFYGGGGSSAVLFNGNLLVEGKGGHGGHPTNVSNYVTTSTYYDESDKKYHTFGITYVRAKSESQALGLTSSDGYEWVEVGHSGSEKTGNGNVLQSIEYSSGVDPMGKAWTYHKTSCQNGHIDDDSGNGYNFKVSQSCGALKSYAGYFSICNRNDAPGWIKWEYINGDSNYPAWSNNNFDYNYSSKAAAGGGTTKSGESPVSYISLSNFNRRTGVSSGNGIVKITAESLIFYNISVINGSSSKYTAVEGESVSCNMICNDALKCFKHWYSLKNLYKIGIADIFAKHITFIMPNCDIELEAVLVDNRLNSNIYKNIFEDMIFCLNEIEEYYNNSPTGTNDFVQINHTLKDGDVVYFDEESKEYKLAIADNSEKSFPAGIVKVKNNNVVSIINRGFIDFEQKYFYTDTCILYLSDKEPGKLSHYQDISNTMFVPVGIYTKFGLFVSIQQGSIGSRLVPYRQEDEFEHYTRLELDKISSSVLNGVKS